MSQLVDEADFQELGLRDAPRPVHVLLRGLRQEQERQLQAPVPQHWAQERLRRQRPAPMPTRLVVAVLH
jgi:hypothetical protein